MKRWQLILAIVILQGPTTAGFLVLGNYSAAALAVTAFVFGGMFGYMAALHLEQPAQPKIEPPAQCHDLVVFDAAGREVA